jgi:crossover junction endodeoxyribonuclease RuvC
MSKTYIQMKNKVILGIDPGTTMIGYGIVRVDGNSFNCLEYGVIRNKGKDKMGDFKKTSLELSAIISKHQPDAVAIERLFFTNNQKTAFAVGEMRGAILLTLATHGLAVREFTPPQVKQAVCNYGKADKAQVQKMVRMILKIPEEIRPDDAADALAIALCGAVGNEG